MHRGRHALALLSLLLPFAIVAACGGSDSNGTGDDAGPDATPLEDAGGADSAPGADASTPDGSSADTSVADTSSADTSTPDGGSVDGADSSAADTSTADTSLTDTSTPDTSLTDTSTTDTSIADTSTGHDSSVVDTGSDSPADAGLDTSVPEDAGSDALLDAPHDSPADTSSPIADASIDVQIFDGGTCNDLVNGGAQVPEMQVAQDFTASGTGGTIAPGLYYLTRWTTYTGTGGASGASGNTRKTALYFEGNTYLKVTDDNGAPDINYTDTWNVDLSNATLLDSVEYCPAPNSRSSFFTATGNTLILSGGSEAYTYTLQ